MGPRGMEAGAADTEWTRLTSGEWGSGELVGKPCEVPSALCSPREALWGPGGTELSCVDRQRWEPPR